MRIMSLILKNLDIGSISRKCSLYSSHIIQSFPISYSDNFQGYPLLSGNGQCLCPPCNYFLKNQDFRKKSWVASEDGIQFLQRRGCQDIILSSPSSPFFFYITLSGQCQGWLDALQVVNYSREKFIIPTGWVGKFPLVQDVRVYISEKYDTLKRESNQYPGTRIPCRSSTTSERRRLRLGIRWITKGRRLKKKVANPKITISHRNSRIISSIADWTWLDVWVYIISNNLPYLLYYDDYGEIVGWDRVRLSTFSILSSRNLVLQIFKVC